MTKWVWFGGAAAIALAMALSISSVSAATLTNGDEQEYTLDMYVGEAESRVTIAAGETIELCPEGCILVLADDELELPIGDELVTITEGRMLFGGSDG